MKRLALPFAFLLCAAALPAAAQPVYACPRYDGSTSYQGTPCVGMASGQQPVVGGVQDIDARLQRVHQAAKEGMDAMDAAVIEEIEASGANADCQRYLKAIILHQPFDAKWSDGCASHQAP